MDKKIHSRLDGLEDRLQQAEASIDKKVQAVLAELQASGEAGKNSRASEGNIGPAFWPKIESFVQDKLDVLRSEWKSAVDAERSRHMEQAQALGRALGEEFERSVVSQAMAEARTEARATVNQELGSRQRSKDSASSNTCSVDSATMSSREAPATAPVQKFAVPAWSTFEVNEATPSAEGSRQSHLAGTVQALREENLRLREANVKFREEVMMSLSKSQETPAVMVAAAAAGLLPGTCSSARSPSPPALRSASPLSCSGPAFLQHHMAAQFQGVMTPGPRSPPLSASAAGKSPALAPGLQTKHSGKPGFLLVGHDPRPQLPPSAGPIPNQGSRGLQPQIAPHPRVVRGLSPDAANSCHGHSCRSLTFVGGHR